MLEKFGADDRVLSQGRFVADEVPYNIIHRISGTQGSTCLKTPDETMIYAQSGGNNAWLWISKEVAADERNNLMQDLLEHLKGTSLPGISGDPVTAEQFAQMYSNAKDLEYLPYMVMESYSCPAVRKPHVAGSMHQATSEYVETVAEFMAGFSKDGHGVHVDTVSLIPAAERSIQAGNLYFWFADGQPVSMANIAHRSSRYGRINTVYTPSAYRKNGYASVLVAELCTTLEHESLEPMLYANLENPYSNKAYRNIGFIAKGKIAEFKFRNKPEM